MKRGISAIGVLPDFHGVHVFPFYQVGPIGTLSVPFLGPIEYLRWVYALNGAVVSTSRLFVLAS